MKFLTLLIVLAVSALAGCTTTANNTNTAIRGTNSNTGYVTNSDSNVKPTIPANATNLTPGNMTNGNTNSTNSNTKRP